MTPLTLDHLHFRYPASDAGIHGVSAASAQPEIIALIGPNGAGKSTLLDLIAGHKKPASGSVTIGDRPLASLPHDERCRLIAHVPQHVPSDIPFSVEQVILTGRIPHGRGLYESAADFDALEQAIALTRLESFRHRRFSTLSGGERQRVLLAAALCQQSPILLLDEPSAHLDPENEAQLWQLLKSLKDTGRQILLVTHHLALAAQNADRIWLLHQGRLAADAPPCNAFDPQRLEQIFHVPFHWHTSAEGRVFLTYGF